MKEYIVKQGDSLWKIAKRESTTVDAIAHINGIQKKNIAKITIGQKLKLPDSRQGSPDSFLTLIFRGLDFVHFSPKHVEVEHDGKKSVHKVTGKTPLPLIVHDRTKGLKVTIKSPDNKKTKVLDCSSLPVGTWDVAIESRKIKLNGNLQDQHGDEEQTADSARDKTVDQSQKASGQTAQTQTRIEDGQPLHVVSTIYTDANLRLNSGNEKWRLDIIAAAKKTSLTPHAISALINAEGAHKKDGTWIERSNESHPERAQGLTQFFEVAWQEVFENSNSLLSMECQGLNNAALLAKRLEGRYSIDGCAVYATMNLNRAENSTGFPISSLPPDEKAKIAYLLHHEGSSGGCMLLTSDAKARKVGEWKKRLGKQIGSEDKVKQFLGQYKNNEFDAYRGWIYEYIDKVININHFTIQDSDHFEQEPRSVADIVASLNGGPTPPKPVPRETNSAVNPVAISAGSGVQQTASSTSVQNETSSLPPDQSQPSDQSDDLQWSDPLDVCTIRTAGLASKIGAEFGWTRNGGQKYHQGLDLEAEPGTPLRAVANGVLYPWPNLNPKYDYGNAMVLEVGVNDLPPKMAEYVQKINPDRSTIGFFYAHLSEYCVPIDLNEAKEVRPVLVKAGQIIAKSGHTGNAKSNVSIPKGAHLHFEVRLKARQKNPGLENRTDPLPFIMNCTNR